MNVRTSVSLAEGYLLHARPYRDSSVIADFFVADHGRIAVVAKGARRPKSNVRGLLQPFQSLLVSWVSRGSLGTLTALEIRPALSLNLNRSLLSSYYVNELIIRALKPGDSHREVYERYQTCLYQLAGDGSDAPVLRNFEKDLLELLGYGLHLEADVNGAPFAAESIYRFDILEGACAVTAQQGSYSGASLQALYSGDFKNQSELRDAKRLLRTAIDHHLGSGVSRVRKVMSSMSHRRRNWSESSDKTG